jgi:hypothetical protein
MAPDIRILARGYSSPEAAFVPLRSARPWMKNVSGEITAPIAQLLYRDGEGRRVIEYDVRITVEKMEDGFAVVFRVERLRTRELINVFISGIIFSAIVGLFGGEEALAIAMGIALIVGSIRFAIVWSRADQASEPFSLAYGNAA